MKKKMFGAIVTLLLLVSWEGAANALTMEFNSGSISVKILSFTEGNATLSNLGSTHMALTDYYGTDDPLSMHTHLIGGANPSAHLRFAMNDDSLFNFTSIEIVQTSSPLYYIMGSNGASVYLPDGVSDHVMTFSEFSEVRYIDILGDTGNCLTIDNLVYNPVPEPTTMLLLGTGLIGLAGFRRRKKK